MTRITVFDTTLRDGEQSPGASMTTPEKIRMAHQLDELGVDVIEAGFAATSPGERSGVRRVAAEVRRPIIACLARAQAQDIDQAATAVEVAAHPRLHIFIATSDIHLEHKLRIGRQECLEKAISSVERALELVDDVEFTAEDATRTDPGFLCDVVDAAVRAGAGTINVPDTVGYALPSDITAMLTRLLERVPELRARVLSAHCHNDLGLAVANSLAAIQAGARQVECTINGIGERAGNASLEELVMLLSVRAPELGYETGVHSECLFKTSQLLSHLTGIHPQPNKAIVGKNAFAHEAGIHQAGMLRNPLTYEIMTPAMVGVAKSDMVLGKHSGRHALDARLTELGYALSPEELQRAYDHFVRVADHKKTILDEDLLAIVHSDAYEDHPRTLQLKALDVNCGGPISTARAWVVCGSGTTEEGYGSGDGPLDAAFSAVEAACGVEIELEDLQIRASTSGRDALGEVSVQVRIGGRTFSGSRANTDVVTAAAQALLHAVNKARSLGADASGQQVLQEAVG